LDNYTTNALSEFSLNSFRFTLVYPSTTSTAAFNVNSLFRYKSIFCEYFTCDATTKMIGASG
jgi:hypothetical protein